MNLSAQRIDIYDRIDAINAKIKDLEQKKAILHNGIKELDNGESMIDGKGLLAAEVKKIMRDDI